MGKICPSISFPAGNPEKRFTKQASINNASNSNYNIDRKRNMIHAHYTALHLHFIARAIRVRQCGYAEHT